MESLRLRRGGGCGRDARGPLAEAVEDGLQGLSDDGLGEGARGVVGAGAAAFVGGLEDDGAGGDGMRGGAAVDAFVEGGEEVVEGGGGFERLGGGVGELGVGLFEEEFLAVGGFGGEEGIEGKVDGCAVAFLGLEGDHAARGFLDLEAHDGFIDGADLLDIEGAVGEALAGEVEEEFQHFVNRAVGDAWDGGAGVC